MILQLHCYCAIKSSITPIWWAYYDHSESRNFGSFFDNFLHKTYSIRYTVGIRLRICVFCKHARKPRTVTFIGLPTKRPIWNEMPSSSSSKFLKWPKQLKLLQGPLFTKREHKQYGEMSAIITGCCSSGEISVLSACYWKQVTTRQMTVTSLGRLFHT